MLDANAIQAIANAVASQLTLASWQNTILIVVFGAGGGAIGAYFGGYLKLKGENLATKEDFNELRDRLKANTEAVEMIKEEVAFKNWTKREWASLRRAKLEELLNLLHECSIFLHRCSDRANEGKGPLYVESPAYKMDTISLLYFPEIREEIRKFTRNILEQTGVYFELAMANLAADMPNKSSAEQVQARSKANEEIFKGKLLPLVSKKASLQDAAENAAAKLLRQVAGIE